MEFSRVDIPPYLSVLTPSNPPCLSATPFVRYSGVSIFLFFFFGSSRVNTMHLHREVRDSHALICLGSYFYVIRVRFVHRYGERFIMLRSRRKIRLVQDILFLFPKEAEKRQTRVD